MSCKENSNCKNGLKCNNGTCCKSWVMSSSRDCSRCQTKGKYAGNCGCNSNERKSDWFCKNDKEPCGSNIIPWRSKVFDKNKNKEIINYNCDKVYNKDDYEYDSIRKLWKETDKKKDGDTCSKNSDCKSNVCLNNKRCCKSSIDVSNCSECSNSGNCRSCNENYELNSSGSKCNPEKCSINSDCNNNATSVSGDKVNGCICTCNNFYSGVKCENLVLCTINDNCNGNALSVQGSLKDGCNCECNSDYSGSFCDTLITQAPSVNKNYNMKEVITDSPINEDTSSYNKITTKPEIIENDSINDKLVTEKPLKIIEFKDASPILTQYDNINNNTEYIPINYYCNDEKNTNNFISEFNDITDNECAKKCDSDSLCTNFKFLYSSKNQKCMLFKKCEFNNDYINENGYEVVYEKINKNMVDCECVDGGIISLYNGCKNYEDKMKCIVKGGIKSKCDDKKIYNNATNLYYSNKLCQSDDLPIPSSSGCYYLNRSCGDLSVNEWTKDIDGGINLDISLTKEKCLSRKENIDNKCNNDKTKMLFIKPKVSCGDTEADSCENCVDDGSDNWCSGSCSLVNGNCKNVQSTYKLLKIDDVNDSIESLKNTCKDSDMHVCNYENLKNINNNELIDKIKSDCTYSIDDDVLNVGDLEKKNKTVCIDNKNVSKYLVCCSNSVMKLELSNEDKKVNVDVGCTKDYPYRTKLEEHKPDYSFCLKNKECSINNSLDCSINDIKRIPNLSRNLEIFNGCTFEYPVSSNSIEKCYKELKCLEKENDCNSEFIYRKENNISIGCTSNFPHRTELEVHKPNLGICFNNKDCSTTWSNSCWQNIKFIKNISKKNIKNYLINNNSKMDSIINYSELESRLNNSLLITKDLLYEGGGIYQNQCIDNIINMENKNLDSIKAYSEFMFMKSNDNLKNNTNFNNYNYFKYYMSFIVSSYYKALINSGKDKYLVDKIFKSTYNIYKNKGIINKLIGDQNISHFEKKIFEFTNVNLNFDTEYVTSEKIYIGENSYVCTALYKNNYLSKNNYIKMKKFGIWGLKNKQHNNSMRLYFGAMNYVLNAILKTENNNKNFWIFLDEFMKECIYNIDNDNKDIVVSLFSKMCLFLTEKYFKHLSLVPKIKEDKNYDSLIKLYNNEINKYKNIISF